MRTTHLACVVSLILVASLVIIAANPKAKEDQATGTNVVIENTELTFDPKTVLRGSAGFGWGLGSVRVVILGREKDRCIFHFWNEIEGGYRVYRCSVRLDEPVRIHVDDKIGGVVTSFPLKDAKIVENGNMLIGPRAAAGAQVVWSHQPVTGTTHVCFKADVIIGRGDEAKPGSGVSIRYRLFANDFTTEFIGIPRDNELTFTIGKSKAGLGIEAATLGMKSGGRRFATMRQELAAVFVKQLGGIQPETQFEAEIELLEVK